MILMVSCSSNSDSNLKSPTHNGILTGNFIEVLPEANRTTLIFSPDTNQLEEKRNSDEKNSITLTYSIQKLENNQIELNSNEADEAEPKIIYYKIIDDDTFEIGNLNANDPENTIMSFARNE